MTAFETDTELFNYFRQKASEMNCKQCFDKKQDELHAMNREGENGVPNCLCKINTPCPCEDVEDDLLIDGICYCEIFESVEK